MVKLLPEPSAEESDSFVESSFWISQCFGALAILFDLLKFTRKTRTALILWGIPAGWSMVASQYFLGQGQGATFQAMSSLETLLQAWFGRNNWSHRWFRLVTASTFAGIGFLVYAPTSVWFTWLPVGAYFFGTAGKIFHNPLRIRAVWLVSSSCIFWYAAIYHNWTIMLQQILVVTLSLAFIYREFRPKLIQVPE